MRIKVEKRTMAQKRWKSRKMTRKVNPNVKGAVLLIMQENLAAIREICAHAVQLVSKFPKWPKQSKSQGKTKLIKNPGRNKKE